MMVKAFDVFNKRNVEAEKEEIARIAKKIWQRLFSFRTYVFDKKF